MTQERSNLVAQFDKTTSHGLRTSAVENWPATLNLIKEWWRAYKQWEARDDFNIAHQDDRMTVRTFSSNFEDEKSKHFDPNSKETKFQFKIEESDRFMTSKTYGERPKPETQKDLKTKFHSTEQKSFFHANRGIDGSAFADPKNFFSTEKKYAEGLHDLSASLLDHKFPIINSQGGGQVHHKGDGAHFVFLPLSEQEDQVVIYTLIRAAKALKNELGGFYDLIRSYRSEMTRVKLAFEYDMGIGYAAFHAPTQNEKDRQFKLRYGLTDAMTYNSQTHKITPELYQARQQSAIAFKSILGKRPNGVKNEIILAVRKHNGAFPVYARREDKVLKCFTIENGAAIFNGKTISLAGTMSN